MARRPVKGHIALWLIGRSTDDPRVHDMLNTLAIYSFVRLVGPSAFHYGQLVAFVPKVAYHYWMQPKTGRGVRVISPHGESPVRWEYTKSKPHVPSAGSGPATSGVARAVGARTVLPFLLGGFLVNRMYSLDMFRSESIVH